MKKLFILILSLYLFSLANAQVSNARINFSCPSGQITVTYDLNTSRPTDVTLYYSHNKRDWFIAQTVTGDLTAQTTGTGKTIIWDCFADNVRFGGFYFKIEIPPLDCVMINGVCWATRNVDAPGTFAKNPEDFGMFYQWNRNVGWSSTDPMINSNGGTTWNSSMPTGTVWETTNNICPAGYRMPTHAEQQSLASVDSQWTTINGVTGRIFGSDNETIFLPAAGTRLGHDNGRLYDIVIGGYYWSSTNSEIGAHALHFNSGNVFTNDLFIRTSGLLIRCVAE